LFLSPAARRQTEDLFAITLDRDSDPNVIIFRDDAAVQRISETAAQAHSCCGAPSHHYAFAARVAASRSRGVAIPIGFPFATARRAQE